MKTTTQEILIRLEKFEPMDQNMILVDVIRQLQARRVEAIAAATIAMETQSKAFDDLKTRTNGNNVQP